MAVLTPQQLAVKRYRERADAMRREAFVKRAHKGDEDAEVRALVRSAAYLSTAAYCENDPEACKEREKP